MGSRSGHSVARRRQLLPSLSSLTDMMMTCSPRSSANRAQRRRAEGVLRRYTKFITKHESHGHEGAGT